jgi:hypothetical protein
VRLEKIKIKQISNLLIIMKENFGLDQVFFINTILALDMSRQRKWLIEWTAELPFKALQSSHVETDSSGP